MEKTIQNNVTRVSIFHNNYRCLTQNLLHELALIFEDRGTGTVYGMFYLGCERQMVRGVA